MQFVAQQRRAHHRFDDELNKSNLANHSNLATGCWKSVAEREHYFLSTKMLSIPFIVFWQIGMLGGGHVLHLLWFREHVLFQCSRSAGKGTFSLCGPLAMRSPYFTFSLVIPFLQQLCSMSFVFLMSIKNAGFALFLGSLEKVTRFLIHFGAFAATNCFRSGSPSCYN